MIHKTNISKLPKASSEAQTIAREFENKLRLLEHSEKDLARLRAKIREGLSTEELALEFEDEITGVHVVVEKEL